MTATQIRAPAATAAPAGTPRESLRRRSSATGLAVGVTFFCLSLTPSLLPRHWFVQGVLSGILAATGYSLGVLASHVARNLVRWRPSVQVRRAGWRLLAAGSAVAIAAFLYLGAAWRAEIVLLMGQPPQGRVWHVASLAVAAVVSVALIAIARGLRLASRILGGFLGRWIPRRLASITAGVAMVAVLVGLLDGVVYKAGVASTDDFFRALNEQTAVDRAPPSSPSLSGGPGSLMTWESLGRWGRDFVAGGPAVADLERFSGRPAVQPVRAYAGLGSGSSLREKAALAVAELQRSGGFDRRALVVVTTTGTGWVNSQAVDAIEYMYNGDTAVVGLQYSHLPSVLSFLVDQTRAAEASRQLFNATYEVWSALDEDERPLLLVFGESLGSYGSEEAFSGVADLVNRTDGALWVGPMNFNPLWREFVVARDPGSTEVRPVYEGGATVRFGATGADLDRLDTPWAHPRVVYLQQASDPVVWWSPQLILRRPDWLKEPRGDGVLPRMAWHPFVTFWQVTADLALATGAPPGHGHNYGARPVEAWARIAPPPGWTPADTERLSELIEANGRRGR